MSKELDDLINEKVNIIKERRLKEYLENLEYINKGLYSIAFLKQGIYFNIRANQDKSARTYLSSALCILDEKSDLYTSFPNLKKLIGLTIDTFESELFNKLKELIINELKKMQDRFETDVIDMEKYRVYY